MISEVDTSSAPAAVGPYSQAIRIGNLLFVSGQLPLNPLTNEIDADDAVTQAEQCLRNIQSIAAAAGTDLSKAVKTTVLLQDLTKFAEVNDVYARFFRPPYPARACYEVSALPRGAAVEIEAVIAI